MLSTTVPVIEPYEKLASKSPSLFTRIVEPSSM
jgi:hypothetical protein